MLRFYSQNACAQVYYQANSGMLVFELCPIVNRQINFNSKIQFRLPAQQCVITVLELKKMIKMITTNTIPNEKNGYVYTIDTRLNYDTKACMRLCNSPNGFDFSIIANNAKVGTLVCSSNEIYTLLTLKEITELWHQAFIHYDFYFYPKKTNINDGERDPIQTQGNNGQTYQRGNPESQNRNNGGGQYVNGGQHPVNNSGTNVHPSNSPQQRGEYNSGNVVQGNSQHNNAGNVVDERYNNSIPPNSGYRNTNSGYGGYGNRNGGYQQQRVNTNVQQPTNQAGVSQSPIQTNNYDNNNDEHQPVYNGGGNEYHQPQSQQNAPQQRREQPANVIAPNLDSSQQRVIPSENGVHDYNQIIQPYDESITYPSNDKSGNAAPTIANNADSNLFIENKNGRNPNAHVQPQGQMDHNFLNELDEVLAD